MNEIDKLIGRSIEASASAPRLKGMLGRNVEINARYTYGNVIVIADNVVKHEKGSKCTVHFSYLEGGGTGKVDITW